MEHQRVALMVDYLDIGMVGKSDVSMVFWRVELKGYMKDTLLVV